MGTAMLTNRLDLAQHTAAKVAGFLYLFTMVTASFAEFYARGRLIVGGDAVQTAKNIATSERLFRLGTVSNLITFAAVVILLSYSGPSTGIWPYLRRCGGSPNAPFLRSSR